MTTRARCLAAARAFANTSLRSTGSVAHAMLAAYSSDTAALIGVGAAVLLLLLVWLAALGALPVDSATVTTMSVGVAT